VTHLHPDGKFEVTPEGTNATFTHDELRRYIRTDCETSLGVLLVFVCFEVSFHRTVCNVADVFSDIGRRSRYFGDFWRSRRGTSDCQASRATPIDLDQGGIFDTWDLDFNEIVRDSIADVYIGVVGVSVRVWDPALEAPEKGIVLVFPLMKMIHDFERFVIEFPGVRHCDLIRLMSFR
jgi:hypothetical protein